MYLHMLEKDEKTAFLSFARHLARIDDDQIDDRERYTIQYMCAEMGVDPATESPAFNAEDVANVFLRDEARRILILEGLGVSFANGAMESHQRELIASLAAKFGLADDFVARGEAVIQKQIEVMQEFDDLIGG